MIEVLTIVKTMNEKGVVNFQVNGNLGLDDAVNALGLFAVQQAARQKETQKIPPMVAPGEREETKKP